MGEPATSWPFCLTSSERPVTIAPFSASFQETSAVPSALTDVTLSEGAAVFETLTRPQPKDIKAILIP